MKPKSPLPSHKAQLSYGHMLFLCLQNRKIWKQKDLMVPWPKLTKKDKAALLKALSVQMDMEGLNENQLGAMCKI